MDVGKYTGPMDGMWYIFDISDTLRNLDWLDWSAPSSKDI